MSGEREGGDRAVLLQFKEHEACQLTPEARGDAWNPFSPQPQEEPPLQAP